MLRRGAIAGVAGLAGCLSTPDPAAVDAQGGDAAWVCEDGDGDGWPAGRTGACDTAELRDCDDDDDLRHPGAREPGDPSPADLDCDGTAWDGSARMPEVAASQVSGDRLVTIGDLALRIDADQGHSVSELTLGESGNLIFDGPMDERLIGVEAWNDYFSWDGSDDVLVELANNPALFRFQVTWMHGAAMNGVTTWTMHPGGRLYRRDELMLTTAPSESNVTAYVALDDSGFDAIDFESNGDPIGITFGPDVFNTWANLTPSEDWLCAFHSTAGHEIGFLAAADLDSTMTESVRITRSQGPTDATAQLALQYDWNIGGAPPDTGPYQGSFQIVTGATGTTPCTLTAQADAAWRNARGLVLRGAISGTAPDGEDQNGDDFAEGGGYYPVIAQDPELEIELMEGGTVPPTITFRIEDLPAGDPLIFVIHDEVELRAVHGRDYQFAHDGGFAWLVIEALPGDVIRIVTPPAS